MELHLLSDVRQTDGPTIGELRHVVCESASKKVLSIVVQETGLDGRAVIVPIELVSGADDDAVSVNLDEATLHTLEPYAFGLNTAPPPADIADDVESEDYRQEFIDIPNVPPVGAAQGITTIAFTPILEVWRNVPEGAAIIGDKTTVSARDGDLGDVERVVVDDGSKIITKLIVESSGLLTHTTEIPADMVGHIDSERIDIAADRADVDDQENS